MAKKRKQSSVKKHNFSADHLQAAALAPTPTGKAKSESAPQQKPSALADTVVFDTTKYVKSDLRRVLLLAAVFIGLEIVLWVLFEHTGLGNAVYNSVKI